MRAPPRAERRTFDESTSTSIELHWHRPADRRAQDLVAQAWRVARPSGRGRRREIRPAAAKWRSHDWGTPARRAAPPEMRWAEDIGASHGSILCMFSARFTGCFHPTHPGACQDGDG